MMNEAETKVTIVCKDRSLTKSEVFELQREIHIEQAVSEAMKIPPFSTALITNIGILEDYKDGRVNFTPSW
jgi:hypothetical protein